MKKATAKKTSEPARKAVAVVARGGGWNKKTLDEHLQDGTYRADRHGRLAPQVLQAKKPPGKVRSSAKSQGRWCQSEADYRAVRAGYRFNERLAAYVADFFLQHLRFSKGEWAGKPFELIPWQREKLIYPLFGWVNEEGHRRFRVTYIELPKKNLKSTTAAGIGLFMMTGDDEPGAELWSLGADRDQARVVHNEAVSMVEGSEALGQVLKVNHSTFTITYPALNSYYRAVSASPRGKHGPSIHCAIADEVHEWYGDELWNSVRYSMRARRQPLLLAITNAGDNLQSLCYRLRQKAQAVIDGTVEDHRFFALIASSTREEAEEEIASVREGATSLPVARRCNPAIDVVIREEDLLADVRDAITTPAELPNLLRLTYGVWATGVSPWLNSQDWEACGEDYTAETLAGQLCHAGLDMSLTGDMSALVLIFPDPDDPAVYRQLAWCWLPEKTVAERKHLIDYQSWADAGWLRIMPGAVIDYAQLRQELLEILRRYQVQTLSYDAMYASDTAQHLADELADTEVEEFKQALMTFATPTAEYERLVKAGLLRHNRNALLTWQAGHCTVYTDSNKNRRPVKPKHGDIRSIDAIVAGIMACRNAVREPETSAYDDPQCFQSVGELMAAAGDGEQLGYLPHEEYEDAYY